MKRILRSTRSILVLLSICETLQARAEIPRLRVSVDGLACPFCAYGLEKKLSRLEGVEELEISLDRAAATLSLAEDASPDLDAIRRAVKDAGFAPAPSGCP